MTKKNTLLHPDYNAIYLHTDDEKGMNLVAAEKLCNCCAKEKKQCLKPIKSEFELKSMVRKLGETAALQFQEPFYKVGECNRSVQTLPPRMMLNKCKKEDKAHLVYVLSATTRKLV